MSVDWSAFRDGDKIRVSFEGFWRTGGAAGAEYAYFATGGMNMHLREALYPAASAELIERPFTPPPAGTLFRNESLFISTGDGFRCVRLPDGKAYTGPIYSTKWSGMAPKWLAGIEVLDV